ncbi:MAG TPA: hypothetical protein VFP60_09985 [Pseudolabrys sp.]|nr:hypothetical protein [Pseudolabrys sp.]
MRELVGKIARNRGLLEEVYLTEHVRCVQCQKTAPMGIEVVTTKKEGTSKKILKRAFYCRVHGGEYQSKAQGDG